MTPGGHKHKSGSPAQWLKVTGKVPETYKASVSLSGKHRWVPLDGVCATYREITQVKPLAKMAYGTFNKCWVLYYYLLFIQRVNISSFLPPHIS